MLPFTLSHVSVFLLTVMTTATITTIIFYTGIGPRGAFVVLVQNLGQIMSNIVKKVKKQAISLGFFHILLGEYLLKQKVVVVKPPEWNVMVIIARNAKF